MSRNKSKRSRLFFCIIALCFLFGFTTAPLAATTMIYEGLDMQLSFVTGVYQLSIGPLNVSKYSQIRVNTFGNSGSGTIMVTLALVDADGESLGPLDTITIDFNSSATTYVSKTYDIPGRFLKIYMQSLNPTYASLIIFGR